jgi:hypothetical protein
VAQVLSFREFRVHEKMDALSLGYLVFLVSQDEAHSVEIYANYRMRQYCVSCLSLNQLALLPPLNAFHSCPSIGNFMETYFILEVHYLRGAAHRSESWPRLSTDSSISHPAR